ncbi:MAG: crossover junction endodeoxyribonuclease RuvC, partial [Bacteroidales bacterium]
MSKGITILGIDPGTNVTGYGIIKADDQTIEVVAIGVLELEKYDDHYQKIFKIHERTMQLIDQFHPDEFAIEAPFYGKNAQSMIKLGRAQGVAIAAALSRNLPIFEYAPRKVKISVTGNGAACKEQVAGMLESIL